MDSIKYNFGQIEVLRASLATTAATMLEEFRQLKSDIRPMVETWTGDTAAKYQVAQQQWDSSADSLASVLNSLAAAVGRGNDDMAETERAAGRMWAG